MTHSLLYTAYASRQIKAAIAKGYSLQWFCIGTRKITNVKVTGERVLLFDGQWKAESDAEILCEVITRMAKVKELELIN